MYIFQSILNNLDSNGMETVKLLIVLQFTGIKQCFLCIPGIFLAFSYLKTNFFSISFTSSEYI